MITFRGRSIRRNNNRHGKTIGKNTQDSTKSTNNNNDGRDSYRPRRLRANNQDRRALVNPYQRVVNSNTTTTSNSNKNTNNIKSSDRQCLCFAAQEVNNTSTKENVHDMIDVGDADEQAVTQQISSSIIGTAAGLEQGLNSDENDNAMQWVDAAALLSDHLDIEIDGHGEQIDTNRKRIYEYYLPVVEWVAQAYRQHQAKVCSSGNGNVKEPMVIGISAPQGCGKTTIVDALVKLLPDLKQLSTVNISIDDFYLTREEQQRVADTSGNRLLQVRGNAGTHDLALGAETIAALKDSALKSRAEGVRVPRYNKSASGGKGDRHPIEQWPEVAAGEGTGVDIILFEGWMLGFTPLEEKDGDLGDLQMIDDQLGAYKSWNDVVDAWMVVRIEDLDCVYDWRMQAERKMRSEGKVGMSDDEVRDFVDQYMPAYKAYLSKLYKAPPMRSEGQKVLYIDVDKNRNPVHAECL